MGTPTFAHVIFIPFVLLVGIALGFVMGGRAAREAEVARRARQEERQKKKMASSSALDKKSADQ